MPCCNGRLQQIERPGHVDVHKSPRRKSVDIRLMERTGMDDRFNVVVGKGTIDCGPVLDRTDDVGVNAWSHVEANDCMAAGAELRREETAQPARRSGEQNAHCLPFVRSSRSRPASLNGSWPRGHMIHQGEQPSHGCCARAMRFRQILRQVMTL